MESQFRRTSSPIPEIARRKPSSESKSFPEDQFEESKFRKHRSLSEGSQVKSCEETFKVFPSLPDAVLEKLGLIGELRNTISEEELEKKFITLALAFTIDSTTVKDRRERQKRQRDQTESNLKVEITKIIEKVNRIQPISIDAHTAQLLTGILVQTELIEKASSHATIAAERFGAVQHEDRLVEAVNLMIKHVTVLKQQRDSIRKQLQYTRRVLQDTPNSSNRFRPTTSISNGPGLTKRRASIATFTQNQENKASISSPTEIRWLIRRTSDISSRSLSIRPNRLELGVDLDKIKEGIFENNQETVVENLNEISEINCNGLSSAETNISKRQGIMEKLHNFYLNLEEKYENVENNSLQQVFYYSSVVCFLLGLVILLNIFIELRLCKNGYPKALAMLINPFFVNENDDM